MNTINTYKKRIFQNLGINTMVEAVHVVSRILQTSRNNGEILLVTEKTDTIATSEEMLKHFKREFEEAGDEIARLEAHFLPPNPTSRETRPNARCPSGLQRKFRR